MTLFTPTFDTLGAIERPLHTQLAIASVVLLVAGAVTGHAAYGVSAAAGVLASMVYYVLLGAQVRRHVARLRAPHVAMMIVSLLGRQIICLAVPSVCFFALGQAWWASLVTLIIARHWVMLVAANMDGQTPRASAIRA